MPTIIGMTVCADGEHIVVTVQEPDGSKRQVQMLPLRGRRLN